jgi:Mg2+ and Co2+ transporter CorA
VKALTYIPLVSWENGIWMIGVFVLVVVVLVVAVLALMNSGKK